MKTRIVNDLDGDFGNCRNLSYHKLLCSSPSICLQIATQMVTSNYRLKEKFVNLSVAPLLYPHNHMASFHASSFTVAYQSFPSKK